MSEPCCYRKSNADDPSEAELRLAFLRPTAPTTLANNTLVEALLSAAFDEERFNWLVRISGITGEGGEVAVTTGFGRRSGSGADVSFAFVDGDAPAADGDPNRWNPLSTTGTLTVVDGDESNLALGPVVDTITLPIVEIDSDEVSLELPLASLELTNMALTENRSCVGERTDPTYTPVASLVGYLPVEDTKNANIDLGTVQSSVCKILAGIAVSSDEDCNTRDQTKWSVPPDSSCTGTGCNFGDCTPADCNAWLLTGEFAAQGVEVTGNEATGDQ